MTGKRRVTDEQLECECWCGLLIVKIPAEWVAGGRTRSCGAPGCSEDGKYLGDDYDTDRDVVDAHEAAAMLGIKPRTVNWWASTNRLRTVGHRQQRRGRPRRLFLRADVERLAKERS